MTEPRFIAIGEVVGAHGVRGELKVLTYSGSGDRFAGVGRVFLDLDGQRVAAAVVSERPHGKFALVGLEGVEDRTAAERLRGAVIEIPRAELPDLPEGTYYACDLVGLTCESTSGDRLGTVVDVLAKPANDVLVVRMDSGEEFLVPAVREIVRDVDVPRGKLVILDLPGLR
ncbi:MAG: ribosome maturation factor RimM [Firmicutes bacterium]|jgi:16S rRNA processing protein RimM|nr:ribosome maturation factor RimM [Bacillota bacterium]